MSDILYTSGLSKAVINTAVTSEATGYPIENVLDFNPNTYWKPTSTANQTLDFDLGSALEVDNIVLILKNYETDFVDAGANLYFESDDNDNGSYSAVTQANSISSWQAAIPQSKNVYFQANILSFTSVTKRFWRIRFVGMVEVVEVACIYFCSARTIAQSHEMSRQQGVKFNSISQSGAAGIEYVKVKNTVPIETYNLLYRVSDIGSDTDYTSVINAYKDCQGRVYPLVMISADLQIIGNYRFTSETANVLVRDFKLYDVTLGLEEVPYPSSGGTY